jgi:MFS family permease
MAARWLRDERRSPFVVLLTAGGIASFGNVLTFLAIPWFVLTTTGSAAQTGLVVFSSAIASLLALFFGGVIVDRLDYRIVSVVGDIASGISVAMIPLLELTVGLELWQIMVLVFTGALLDTPADTARISAVPEASKLAGLRMERANAVLDSSYTAGDLTAPLLAGVLIATIGPSNLLWVTSGTFAISALLIATKAPAGLRETGGEHERPAGYRAQFMQGLRFIRWDRVIFPMVVIFAVAGFVTAPFDSVIAPVYANEVFASAWVLSLMFSARAVGFLLANISFGWFGHRFPRRAALAGCFAIQPLILVALGFLPGLPVVILVMVLYGFSGVLVGMLEFTIYFERIPSHIRARVLGLIGSFAYCADPAGQLLGGNLVEWFGLAPTLFALGILGLPIPLLILLTPGLRDLSAPAQEQRLESQVTPPDEIVLTP